MCVSEITAAGFCGLCGGVNSFAGKAHYALLWKFDSQHNPPPPPIIGAEQSLLVTFPFAFHSVAKGLQFRLLF